jgi:hypothetical protein
VLDVENPSEIYGDRSNTFGFDAVGIENLRVLSVKVYHKPLARRISPLAVGDKLLQIGDYARAAAAYLDVARSYPDEDLTAPATFRYAVCRLRLDDPRACDLLERFIADHPRDHAVPYALLELVRAKRKAGDQPAVERLCERCAAWKGEPALARVIGEIADQRHGDLAPVKITRVGESEWPAGSSERIVATIAELRRWGERFGVDWWGNSYAFDAGSVLQWQGRQDDILAVYPPRSQFYQEALLRQSRFRELLELSSPGSSLRGLALMHLGRVDEVVAGEQRYPEWLVAQALLDQGRLAELVAQPERLTSERPRLLVLAGRFQEVLDKFPDDQSAVASALTALGRAGEIEGRVTIPRALATMLVDTRRYDELFARYPNAYEELYRAALHLWIEGEHERARALLGDLAHAVVSPALEATMVARHVFPGMVRVWSGERVDLHALFDAEIAEAKRDRRLPLWYLLSYVVGDIDEAAFRAQEDRYLIDDRLLLAKAIAADVRGREDQARAAYALYAQRPCLTTSTLDFNLDLVRWRAGMPPLVTTPSNF